MRFLFALILTVQADPKADFYVAPNGNDTASGMIDAPFATVLGRPH